MLCLSLVQIKSNAPKIDVSTLPRNQHKLVKIRMRAKQLD